MAYFIGLMSGTSMDAIDAAALDLRDKACRLVACHSHPIPYPLGERLQRLIRSETFNVRELGSLDVELGRLFADAVNQLLREHTLTPGDITAIGSHGQTVFHAPDDDPPFTLQIGDPNSIAQLTGITTVADLRRRDMAAGGQGAPLATAFHDRYFRSGKHNRVILNIGGIANITVLAADQDTPVFGFDTGPGNCLLDNWIQQHRDERFDRDGAWGAGGTVNNALLFRLLADPYLAAPPPKSTGREHFNLHWLQQHSLDDSPQNIQATLTQLTVESIAAAIEAHAPQTDELFICGGGAYNSHLVRSLEQRLGRISIATTSEFGIAPDWVEAAAFAWLAQQTLENRPGNLTDVTGASEAVILGGVYAGHLDGQ